ncbi:MAG: ABC transporter ATP-binding protein, partial [Rhodobacteraceae bacterium]|nr:ABC transporter ATP-binding protein [Paracoccaceae bacterium]
SQRPQRTEETVKSGGRTSVAAAPKPAEAPRGSTLSFTERKRLDDLPGVISRLEAEIARLHDLLADPELFTREPVKFRKATEALTERQTALETAETEWLDLADRV